jgi:membrane protein DedA with SNARE-associated domain
VIGAVRSWLAGAAPAVQSFDPAAATAAVPLGLPLALAAATLVSEDLTCVAAGLLVARGELGFATAVVACFLGIFVGDLLLVAAGRWLGRPALDRRPLRWLVTPESVERSARWFARKGARVVFVSRFVPGSRTALFLAAGLLRAPVAPLALALAVAGAIWTPLLVGLATYAHSAVLRFVEGWGRWAVPAVLAAAILVLFLVEVLVPALTWRGRRLLLSRWRRTTRWEFWPLWLFQLPVALHWLRLAVRFRHPTLFTAANPGIPAGGFVLESKSAILSALGAREVVPPFVRIDFTGTPEERTATATAALAASGFGLPAVGKPDVGERGEGVTVVRTPDELAAWAAHAPKEAILQRYAPGEEFGVFYLRRPDDDAGSIFSITRKEFPQVVGDGARTLEELILADDRAVCMAPVYLAVNGARLDQVPAAGERVRLVEIGNHCRGTVFRDGRALATPALARRVDEIAKSFPGFYFGRFDLRAPSLEAFQAGRELAVLEVNGVTSEATHIYEPGASLREAYRTLFAQWRHCFEIGAANARRGARPAPVRELLGLLHERRRLRLRAHLDRTAES